MRAAVSRRVVALGGLVLLAGLGAGGVVVSRTLGEPSCAVTVDELSGTAAELVPADDLLPEGTVGDDRRPVVDAVAGLDLGTVVAGRFFDSGVPALVPVGDELALATPRTLRVLELPDGTVSWGRGFGAAAAGGGLVGDRFVTLVGGSTPTLVSLDPASGEVDSCVEVPTTSGEATTLLTDQAGADVVVAVGAVANSAVLSKVDPSGDVGWERTLDGVTEVGSVDVHGSSVVVGRLRDDPVRRSEMAAAGGIDGPTVTTYSLSDGKPGWTFPSDPGSTAASVVGTTDDGLLLALTAQGPRKVENRLVALDAAGEEVWSVELGPGYWTASLWGRAVVAQGADPAGGPQLRAFEPGSGEPLWRVRSSDAPPKGKDPRTTFGPAVTLGDTLALPAPNGVLLVDPDSGEVERRDSDVAVEELFPSGDHLVVRTDEALLVVRGSV